MGGLHEIEIKKYGYPKNQVRQLKRL